MEKLFVYIFFNTFATICTYCIESGNPSKHSDVITLLHCKSSEIELTNFVKINLVIITGAPLKFRHFFSLSNFSITKKIMENKYYKM